MKKLAALASMAVLLCASASFAKKAMDEEEMDLVTAAGQPSVIDVSVETTGIGDLTSTTTADTSNTATSNLPQGGGTPTFFVGDNTAAAFEANAALSVGDLEIAPLLGPTITLEDAAAALNLDFSFADIETFSMTNTSGTATLTATSSAAASSTVSGATASVTATNEDSSLTTLLIAASSQSNLRALALNNVAGENQIANAINVEAGARSSSGSQTNAIDQSWGSTFDWSSAEADGGAGGAGGAGGTITTMGPNICLTDCADGGDGGDGGDGEVIPLTISADRIARVDVESMGDATVDVSQVDKSAVLVNVDSFSQNNLAALFVNNVGGKNQVANALNTVSSGGLGVGDNAGNNFVAILAPVNGVSNFAGHSQSNTIRQFRGTPISQP